MDMAAFLDELTYRVLASAASGNDARARLAVVIHWAQNKMPALLQGGARSASTAPRW